MNNTRHSFDELSFDNRFTNELPADPILENRRHEVRGALYSRVKPANVRQPRLVDYSSDVMAMLNLDQAFAEKEAFTRVLVGNELANDMDPYASCYGGHQFGNWAGQLGDGRAINLGEILNAAGERWALQLKGAGPTPYSRQADGLAVLRSSVREFLCSEAMYHLGVPTTRALSLIETGEPVMRVMFYDGNAKPEPGAVVCRVAPSFTRFGHFQILVAQNDLPLLKQFIDYTLRTDFAHEGPVSNDNIVAWFIDVCERTADMIAHWMRVGFVHGVMNTDNMSILGLTIDYGPYGWLDNYDPDWTPNTTDAQYKRYRYSNQPDVAHWNLLQLAQALATLTEEVAPLQAALQHYVQCYQASWATMRNAKFGLAQATDEVAQSLGETGLALLQATETDMTIFFRNLSMVKTDLSLSNEALLAPLLDAFYAPNDLPDGHLQQLSAWLRALIPVWQASWQNDALRVAAMNLSNPKYVLRNYLAQQAIDLAEKGDYSMVRDLQAVLKNPYDEQPGKDAYAGKRPDWARNRAGCSMLSCSS